MPALTTVDFFVLGTIAILLLLTIAFAILYFSASASPDNLKAENRRLRAQIASLEARLQQQSQQPQTMTETEPEATRILAAERTDPQTAINELAVPATVAIDEIQALPYLITVENNTAQTQRFVLKFGTNTIGRSSKSDIVLNDAKASREHATVFFRQGQFILKDHESTNYTLCNNQPVTEQILQFGDVIRFADTEMIYSLPGFELMQTDPQTAIEVLEQTLAIAPGFIPALRTMAFLLERDVARRNEAHTIWARLKAME